MIRQTFLDHQSGMPVDQRVVDEMLPYFNRFYGNPSSIHSWGIEAKKALDTSRERVANLIGAKKSENIIFTSGGTEGNNLSIRGVSLRNKDKGNHIIISKIEHISVVNICKSLERQGFKVTYLPVDRFGIIDIQKLIEELTDKTILISIMYANNEIGTVEPIREIGEITSKRNIPLHVDAVAAAGKVPMDVEKERIDLLTMSSNDMYGPKGVGALYISEGIRIIPITFGGGQERGLRSGTENIPGIVGMGKAAEIAKEELGGEKTRLTVIRDKIINEILRRIPESYLNGHPTLRLPDNINIRFRFIEGESIILSLESEGIAASSGSACTSKTLEPSAALLATGLSHEEAHGSLYISLGKQNTLEDADYLISVLPEIVKRLRSISPLTPKELR
jgi:cysteine desulfurase